MNGNKVVDVVIPNYNKVKFIKACLNSLVEQNYHNWRCIAIDGYSDDGSWEIIKEYAAKDPRFEIYQLQRNGLYNSWNFGLSKVKNSYFCILTSDDTWEKNWLEIAVNSLESNLNAVCAAARTRTIDIEGKPLEIAIHNLMGEQVLVPKVNNSKITIDGIKSCISGYFLGSIYTSIHSLVMRSEIVFQGERFAEDVGFIADYEWYLRIGFYGDVIYHLDVEANHRLYLGQATAKSRLRENGIFMQKIHCRNRELIAKKLSNNKFTYLATKYDKEVLTYRYARPTVSELKSSPAVAVLQFLLLFLQMPIQAIQEIYLKINGKNFYIERSLKNAMQCIKIQTNAKK